MKNTVLENVNFLTKEIQDELMTLRDGLSPEACDHLDDIEKSINGLLGAYHKLANGLED